MPVIVGDRRAGKDRYTESRRQSISARQGRAAPRPFRSRGRDAAREAVLPLNCTDGIKGRLLSDPPIALESCHLVSFFFYPPSCERGQDPSRVKFTFRVRNHAVRKGVVACRMHAGAHHRGRSGSV